MLNHNEFFGEKSREKGREEVHVEEVRTVGAQPNVVKEKRGT